MLITVTTTTTTTAAAAGGYQLAAFGTIGVIILIALLIAKELLSAYGDENAGRSGSGQTEVVRGISVDATVKARSFATSLSCAIYPLLFSFALIVTVKVIEVL
ncbi:MAG: hypothetical protein H0M93_02330 [Methanophagales archaeon]|nr:hypothetical protein [Methanophagales archaeon]